MAEVEAITTERDALEEDFKAVQERQRIAILAALDAGNGPTAIANAAHLSRARVNQIRKER